MPIGENEVSSPSESTPSSPFNMELSITSESSFIEHTIDNGACNTKPGVPWQGRPLVPNKLSRPVSISCIDLSKIPKHTLSPVYAGLGLSAKFP